MNRLNGELEQTVAQRTSQLVGTRNQMQSSLAELREYTRRVEAVNQFVELLQSCLTLEEAYQQSALVLEHFFPAGTLLMLNPSRSCLRLPPVGERHPPSQDLSLPIAVGACAKGRCMQLSRQLRFAVRPCRPG